MIMLPGFATALILGIAGLGICAVILAGLIMAGILPVSVIAGWYKRSVCVRALRLLLSYYWPVYGK